jgi:hypothetical protein
MLRISIMSLLLLRLQTMAVTTHASKNVIIIHRDDGSEEVVNVFGNHTQAMVAGRKKGETPVHICISYKDKSGQAQSWHYGFLIHADEESSLKNFSVVKPHEWQHVAFDLLNNNMRRDPRGLKVLPPPALITRIYVYGSGWDYRGGVTNLWLWKD